MIWIFIIWYLIGVVSSLILDKRSQEYVSVSDFIFALIGGGLLGIIIFYILICELLNITLSKYSKFWNKRLF
jgi:hypothetical protein